MVGKLRFLPMILTVIVTAVPSLLFAAAGHVNFTVVGQASCTKDAPSAADLDIAQACPSATPIITITSNPSTSAAKLTQDSTVDTGNNDVWAMPSNILITANTDISNLHLIFFREATVGPSSGYYYKTWARGAITNGSGSFTVSGLVTRVSDNAQLSIPSFTITASSTDTNGGNFEDSKIAKWSGSMGLSNRVLQVDLVIVQLSSGATIDLSGNGGGWTKIRAQPSLDNPEPPVVCNDSGNWLITTTCATTHKAGYPTNVIAGSTDERAARAYQFAQYNWNNLSQDMAQGQGEHLASLATLLNVPAEQQPAFFQLAQGTYQTSTEVETPEQVIASLHETWSKYFRE